MKNKRKRLKPILNISYFVLIIIFIVFFIIRNRSVVNEYLKDFDNSKLLMSLFMGYLYFTCLALIWSYIQRLLSTEGSHLINYFNWQKIYMLGYLGKYIPGKVAMLFGRVISLEKYGYKKREVVLSSLFENILFIITQLILSIMVYAYLFISRNLSEFRWPLIIVIFLVILFSVIAFSPLFYSYLNWILRKSKRTEIDSANRLSSKQKMICLNYYTIPFIIGGFIFLGFLSSIIDIKINIENILISASLISTSGIIGMMVVILPSGIGVREGILTLGLRVLFGIDLEMALFVTVCYRLLITFIELSFTGSMWLMEKCYSLRKGVE